MQVIKITPRGYCKGVVRAIHLVKEARASYTGNVYVLGMIVHNAYVAKALEAMHVMTLDTASKSKEEWIASIPHGLLIFTAHGISPHIVSLAQARGLDILDASCADVLHTKQLVETALANNQDILYIGKQNHPEAEAIHAICPAKIRLVVSADDLPPASEQPYFVTCQTTMNHLKIRQLLMQIQSQFPNAACAEEICDATRMRQAAAAKAFCDVFIVVGDALSNNSNQLLHMNPSAARRHIIASIQELEPKWFQSTDIVAVSSGASTPAYLTEQVIQYLEELDPTHPHPLPKIDLSRIL